MFLLFSPSFEGSEKDDEGCGFTVMGATNHPNDHFWGPFVGTPRDDEVTIFGLLTPARNISNRKNDIPSAIVMQGMLHWDIASCQGPKRWIPADEGKGCFAICTL